MASPTKSSSSAGLENTLQRVRSERDSALLSEIDTLLRKRNQELIATIHANCTEAQKASEKRQAELLRKIQHDIQALKDTEATTLFRWAAIAMLLALMSFPH